ncbi:hypothetical protein ACH4RA_06090 [Streptomyces smyrnaeus]|uniref:hypothetical protein n=1 Tax=Streptomyces TaxID=1883 RepID=UPI000C177ED4|nr:MULTISPECIES: hypothetical protein [unclassified Streptomyces]MBQ0865087.1 hypothetical protein [Streptomyces sp. RK75]MBQ1119615.1 hypothetical protein [Streptomyces sp. B15]MBQ1161804.1 hypothetical protein [Streptomyces sp. A73]
MKKFLGFVSFVLIVQGGGGLVHEVTDGRFNLPWAAVHRLGLLDGYEVYACVLLIVLGIAVGAASDAVKRRG